MSGFNSITIMGNLGSDPELRYTDGGTAVVNLSVAENESYTNSDGERVENTNWHRVTAWARLAEIISEYKRKGDTVLVQGRLGYRTWEDKEGVERTTAEITAQTVTFVNGGRREEVDETVDEDLPF